MRILVIDDGTGFRQMLTKRLREQGYDNREVSNEPEILATLQRKSSWHGPTMLLTRLLVMMLAAIPVLGQTTGAVHVTLNVPRIVFLSLGSVGHDVRLIDTQPTGGKIHLEVGRPDRGSMVVIPLIARSNTPYRISVRGTNGVGVRVATATPFGGSGHLTAGALAVRPTGGVASQGTSVTILDGPPISRGGNNITTDNALLLELETELPAGLERADLMIEMLPVSN